MHRETGYGRKSEFDDYRVQTRGGKGITNYRTEKYGKVAAVKVVTDEDDIIIIASNGIIIRVAVAEISQFARPSKGVRVMRLDEGERVLSISPTPHDEEEETVAPEAADADAGEVGNLAEEAEIEEVELDEAAEEAENIDEE